MVETLVFLLLFMNILQNFELNPPKRPIFVKKLSIFSCRKTWSLYSQKQCWSFWSLCVGNIRAPLWAGLPRPHRLYPNLKHPFILPETVSPFRFSNYKAQIHKCTVRVGFKFIKQYSSTSVSYTHLTLPTIYSV